MLLAWSVAGLLFASVAHAHADAILHFGSATAHAIVLAIDARANLKRA